MNCTEFKHHLLQGTTAADMEHPQTCESCQILVDSPSVPQFLDSVILRDETSSIADTSIASLLAKERGVVAWLKSRSTRARIGFMMTLMVLIAIATQVAKGRVDWDLYPPLRLTAELALLATALFVATAFALHPMYKPRIRLRRWGSLLAVALVLPFIIALLPVAHTSHPDSLAGLGADLAPRALGCFTFGNLYAIGIAAGFLLFARTIKTGTMLIMSACAAGLLGVIILQIHCPLTGNAHLLWGHATVSLALIGIGSLFSKIFHSRTSNF